jgi:hypothetical protein
VPPESAQAKETLCGIALHLAAENNVRIKTGKNKITKKKKNKILLATQRAAAPSHSPDRGSAAAATASIPKVFAREQRSLPLDWPGTCCSP